MNNSKEKCKRITAAKATANAATGITQKRNARKREVEELKRVVQSIANNSKEKCKTPLLCKAYSTSYLFI